VNINHHVDGSILLMVTWPSFFCYVITYSKDEHSMRKCIRNLRNFVDVIRSCINLYRKVVLCTKHVWCLMMNTYLCEHVFDDVFNQFMYVCLLIIA
jgi:hypothetical protein